MTEWVIVSATTASRVDFEKNTLLGRSLQKWKPLEEAWELDVTFDNREGLPVVYNRALERWEHAAIPHLMLVHDDVLLNDVFLFDKLREGFRRFDLIGIAGATCLDLDRPNIGWCECPPECRAGGVVHPIQDRQEGDFYFIGFGPAPRSCLVVDGVFMALNLRTLRGVRFDERFAFDFYDLDFCLTVRERGGRIGVMPILLTHLSIGASFGSEQFRRAQTAFLVKHGHKARLPQTRPLSFWRRCLSRDGPSTGSRGRIRLEDTEARREDASEPRVGTPVRRPEAGGPDQAAFRPSTPDPPVKDLEEGFDVNRTIR